MRKHNKTPLRQTHVSDDIAQNYSFRRSRTLTGSLHSEVRAASEGNGQLRSSRLHEHDLRSHRRKLGLWLLGVAAAVVMLGALIASYSNDIARVRIIDAPHKTQSELTRYKELAQDYLNQNPLERFRFALNKERLVAYMHEQAPEVIEADIAEVEQLFHSEVVIKTRVPVAVWTSGGKRFYVGEDGVAFAATVHAEPSVSIVDKSANTELGNRAASSKMLRFIGRVVALVNASGVGHVKEVELPSNSTRQADFKLVNKPYIIKTYLERDPAGQAADIVNAVKYFESKGVSPKYIDARISSKAYYQ